MQAKPTGDVGVPDSPMGEGVGRGGRGEDPLRSGSMERPQSIFGLTKHLVTVRWQALSPRGRLLSLAALVFAAVGAVAVAKAAMCSGGGCCASSCASRRAAMEAEAAEIVNADLAAHHAGATPGGTGCPHAAAAAAAAAD